MGNLQFHNDLDRLLEILPAKVRQQITYEQMEDVIEIVLDIGRTPEIRHANGKIEYIGSDFVTEDDINFITSNIQEFTSDNRSGIPGTLHRISAIRNRQGKVIGLTCRIGRVVTGTIACIKDFCMMGKSILFLGRPGVGKTTKLREISRLVADELGKRVVVVDTSNEIAGDGDTPHPAIGHARRMQVRQPEFQKDIMIEAVENHTPEVIVVDEIGTEAEAQAARTIAERGVMLIATAHGTSLESLIKNPTLSDLVGGIQSVTLGDDEARRRASQKTVLEREKQPTFDIVIEILDRNTLAVYKDTSEAVDYILRGWPIRPEIRKVDKIYEAEVQEPKQTVLPAQEHNSFTEIKEGIHKLEDKVLKEPTDSLKFSFSRQQYVKENKKFKKIYLYAVSRTIVEKIIERLDLNAEITRNIDDADIVIAHKNFAKGGARILSTANDYRLQIFYIKTNSMAQIQKVLKEALDITETSETLFGYYDDAERALDEAKAAINKILAGAEHVELTPQNQHIRKLQHELVEQHNMTSKSVGEGSQRHLKIIGGTDYDKKIV
ncbi:TPA: single-stranded DNA-binding protein [Candidatus Scatenecus faecavium]|uniref:Single-stranded DNA-binding protein n=1 Tax=Candidatus Scatenecus faecavium TaxID=2840915 RepID=A0A9D1K5E0_9BACT|nr:single-stranded DNA-binding protein [Candidatus Scatenecus faecavium]